MLKSVYVRIIGKSGSGKSTALKICKGALQTAGYEITEGISADWDEQGGVSEQFTATKEWKEQP